jgi:7-cyano-7-deazaguanine reductase
MARIIDTEDDTYIITDQIQTDLGNAVGGEVSVTLSVGDVQTVRPFNGDFVSLETYSNISQMTFEQFNETPETLEVVPSIGRYERWRSHSLRSNCRVTNQPDWGDVYIHIKGKNSVTPESLLQYIVSMRKENHFHEEIAECIYKRLYDLLQPEELLVGCLYTRRGGIDINPVRASSSKLLYQYAPIIDSYNFCTKTARQ